MGTICIFLGENVRNSKTHITIPLDFDHSPKFDFSATSQSNADKWARVDVRMVLFEACLSDL